MVAFATSPTEAQTTAPGPYYATPSWDQKLDCTTLATCPRFIVLSNWGGAAVLDRETGLVWEKSPSTSTFAWYDAQYHCNTLAVGNRKGWRLPTIQELASLMDPSVHYPPGPSLPAGHPFSNVQVQESNCYWSATTGIGFGGDHASGAWVVAISHGGMAPNDKSFDFFVWCVRGGQGVESQ
jgi:hypothetical protein